MRCKKCGADNPETQRYCGECGTQLPGVPKIAVTETLETPKEELVRGTLFSGRYEIIEELGKGGMGKIYRAFDKKIDEEVALKLLKPEIASDEKTIERFKNELKYARKIAHKNVCKMYDLGEEKGTRYITMEYIPGEDLKSMIKMSGQLNTRTAVKIAKHVCEGLAEAHRLGVIHRDLKPQNIMIDREGNARILDFGIARSLKSRGITGQGMVVGTPDYMSPEQAEVKEVDQRSDIYSLGVILYEMVTGQLPFEGETPLSIAMKHKTETPRNPRMLNPQITEELSLLIIKCMEKDKEKRCRSAGEVLSELEKIEKGTRVTEKIPPEKKHAAEKAVKIRKRALIYGAAVVLVALLGWAGFSLLSRREKPMDSIAVLPFENLSGNPEQVYFADGMTEALISELVKIKALNRVISRTSVMQYKGTRTPMPKIARELNVDVIVEGSVLLLGDKVRLMAQLIHGPTDRHFWAESYERNLSDVLALQGELAKIIAQQIKVSLTVEEEQRLSSGRSVKPEAYEAYLKGRFYLNKRTEDGMKKSVEYFEKAIEIDPSYAAAQAGLADSWILLGDYMFIPPKAVIPKAKEAAKKALEMDDSLAEAHNSLAYASFIFDRDWASAEKGFKRAIELNPNYAAAHQWYGELLTARRRFDEAIKEIRRAQELDPLSLIINAMSGRTYYYAREYDRAIEQYRKTLEIDPDFFFAYRDLGKVYVQKKIYEEALAAEKKANDEAWIGIAYAKMGKFDEARNVLENLIERSKRSYSPQLFYKIAILYFSLEETDHGFKWLDAAYEERDSQLLRINVEPIFDGVRSDPRFKAMLKRLGLE